jgi:glyoxylase I family protein
MNGGGNQMERVAGIGGVFFRAKDPSAVGRWYREMLGVDLVPADYDHRPWEQEAGPTVFAPFPEDTECFGRRAQVWMVNSRVRDLDAMVAQLRRSGVEVSLGP